MIIITIALGVLLLITILMLTTQNKKLRNLENKYNDARRKVEQANKMKTSFLSNLNYEIRTPLNAIVGFSDLMANSSKKNKTDYLNIIKSNNELLVNTINCVMELSEIESGFTEIAKERINLSELFEKALATFSPLLRPEVRIECDTLSNNCIINSDPQRINRIINIFVSNAIKYTYSGKINIGYNIQDNGIKIYVTDTGKGIAENDFAKIFQRFTHISKEEGGAGLGLSLAKAIAEKLGGSVGFKSSLGLGSTFWAWIPAQVEMSRTNSNKPKTFIAKENKPLNILIAEDIDSNFRLIEILLSGHKIERAINGIEAVEKASHGEYGVILMDIRMPEMDGVEATRQIREFDSDTPIIAVTANAFDTDKDMAIKAGCNAFLTKPLSKSQLAQYIPLLDN